MPGPRFIASLVALCTSLSANHAHAQWAWAQRSGGDAVGVYPDAQLVQFAWSWAPAGTSITGTVSYRRTNAGRSYVGAETLAATIGGSPSNFNNSTFANTLGGVTGIRHFISEGDGHRAPNDVPASQVSTTVFSFQMDGAYSTPFNTHIVLFDPGASESGIRGPFTYAFEAWLDGAPVATSAWTLRVEDPYLPAGNSTSNITWNGSTLTLNNYANGASSANYPDTIAFLDTGQSSFDQLRLTAVGIAFDALGVGFGAATAPVCLSIAQQPASALACPTRNADFGVQATGTGPLTYQWQIQTAATTWQTLGPNPILLPCGGTATASASPVNSPQVNIVVRPCPTANLAALQRFQIHCVVSNSCGSAITNTATYTICPADYNCSGAISVQDLFDFLACYFANSPQCDVNGNGSTTVEDVFQFLAAYFTGCS